MCIRDRDRSFSPGTQRCKIFSSSIIHYERFFHWRNFLPGDFLAKFFSLKISLHDIFFLKSPIPPRPLTQKSNGRPTPKHSWDWNSECHWSPKKELQPSVRRQPKLTKDFQSEKILCKPKKVSFFLLFLFYVVTPLWTHERFTPTDN